MANNHEGGCKCTRCTFSKDLAKLYPNKDIILVDEVPPLVSPELAEVLRLLLRNKPK